MIRKLNLAIGLAALAALAACKPSPPAAAPSATVATGPSAPATPGVGEPGYSPPDADDGPMECLAYIDLLRNAIRDGKATGNEAALKTASAAMRAEAHKQRSDDEVAQYYASSVAVFDDLTVLELQRKAAHCLANPPKQPAE